MYYVYLCILDLVILWTFKIYSLNLEFKRKLEMSTKLLCGVLHDILPRWRAGGGISQRLFLCETLSDGSYWFPFYRAAARLEGGGTDSPSSDSRSSGRHPARPPACVSSDLDEANSDFEARRLRGQAPTHRTLVPTRTPLPAVRTKAVLPNQLKRRPARGVRCSKHKAK